MKPSSITLATPVLLLAVLTSGCVSSSAPKDWLPNADRVGQDVYGAWVEIVSDGMAWGELIALTPDSLYYLPLQATDAPTPLFPRAVARSNIEEVRVFWFDAEWNAIALWGLAGTLSTVSHGFILVLSAPIWAISAAASASSRSREPRLLYPDVEWMTLAPYARYPQDLPEPRMRLRPRPQTD